MKKFYLFIMLLMGSVMVNAQTPTTCLTFNFTNDTMAKFAIVENPVVTFDGTDVVVKTSQNLTASYPIADVETFNFTQGTTAGVDELNADKGYDVQFVGKSTIIISGSSVTGATVYAVSGARVADAPAADGVVTISLAELPSGVYVIEIPGHQSLKIQK